MKMEYRETVTDDRENLRKYEYIVDWIRSIKILHYNNYKKKLSASANAISIL